MAFMLGSFSDGLFKGAQSAFSLYDAYQGVVNTSLQNSIAERQAQLTREKREMDASRPVPKNELQDFTKTQPATTPALTPASAPGPAAPATKGPVSTDPDTYTGDAHPALGFDAGIVPDTRRTPLSSAITGGAYETPPSSGITPTYTAPNDPARRYQQQFTTPSPGVASDVAAHDDVQPGPRYAAPNDPGRRYQQQYTGAQTGVSSDVAAHDDVGQPVPSSPSVLTRPSGLTNAPVGTTVGLGQRPQPQLSGTPYSAAGVAGPPGSPSGPPPPYQTMQDPNAPIPRTQPGQPYTPPPQQGSPFNPGNPAVPGGTPGTPGGLVPQASLGRRLLQAVNPVGSAQAAEPTGQEQPTSLAYAPPAPLGSTAPGAQVSMPPETVKPTGITPAEPPTKPPAAQEGPVTVVGVTGKVAPNQKGPSTQSEQTPLVLAPPINPGPWARAQRVHPDIAALITKNVAAHGGGVVNEEEVAAVIDRESGWDPNADASKHKDMGHGQGLMQIEPGTKQELDPNGQMDVWNPDHNIAMGVTYLKNLANSGLGPHTVQTHLAYMRGRGGVDQAKAEGWDSYAKGHPIAASGVAGVFAPGTAINTSMFPSGKSDEGYMRKVIQATHDEGPDGGLRVMGEMGPEGLPMDDRIRNLQADMEMWLIRTGHMDKVGMAAEWVAQWSHQGAVSHMIAADQALLSGNPELAIQHLMKGHAFFPDDTYARGGVDNKGNAWVYTIDKDTHQPNGKPMMVTHEGLLGQIIAMRNPTTYTETLQKMQKTNAEIKLATSHAQYYADKPEVEAERERGRNQRAEDAIAARKEIADARNAAAAAKDASKTANTRAIETEVPKVADDLGASYATDNNGTTAPPEYLSTATEIYRALRLDQQHGGGGFGPEAAKNIAKEVASGSRKFSIGALRDGSGYAVTDKDGKTVRTLSNEQGALIKALPGLKGSEPLQPPGTQKSALGAGIGMGSGVGAGLGSTTAMNAGYGQTLTGLPVRRMQPAQPVTQAA